MAARKYSSNKKTKTVRKNVSSSKLAYPHIFLILGLILTMHWALSHLSFRTLFDHAKPKLTASATEKKNFAVSTDSATVRNISLTPTDTEKESTVNGAETGYCVTVPILFYHHVEPIQEAAKQGHAQLTVDSALFDSQMAYLVQSGYTSFSAEELVAALQSHTPLPQKSVVITFDDGYDDAYNYAFPILKKHHLKGNFMIPTGLVGSLDYMTWEQLQEMKKDSSMSLYNHTVSHASLGGEGREKVLYEIAYANQQLSDHLGVKSNVFTYPYGSFSDVVMQVLSETGFIAALTTLPGDVQCDTMLMHLHRTRIGNSPLSFYKL